MRDRLSMEKEIVAKMICIYCKNNHSNKKELCNDCKEVLEYALNRIDHCKYSKDKDFCSNCKIKCYNKNMGERIRKVMRYSGPRMILHNPILAIRHLLGK